MTRLERRLVQIVGRKITLHDDFLRLSSTKTKVNTSPSQSLRNEVFFQLTVMSSQHLSTKQPNENRAFFYQDIDEKHGGPGLLIGNHGANVLYNKACYIMPVTFLEIDRP